MFYFWFHTAYIKNNYFCLRKRDLEQACKDTNCKHFSNGFKIGSATGSLNTNGSTYLYLAFAEAPLVGSNNIPNTAK